MRARLLVPLVTLVVASGITMSGAAATWSATAAGYTRGLATTLSAPAGATATASSYSATSVTWQPPASGPAPTTYRVVRISPAGVVCEQAAPPCTDSGLTGLTTYTYGVYSLTGSNWVSASAASSTVTTPVNGSFVVTAPATATAGTAFNVTIQARRNGGTVNDTTFTGVKTISWSGTAAQSSPNGTAATLPTSATFNASGLATVSVTLTRAAAGQTLTVNDPQGRTGTSGALTVSPATPALLVSCPASGVRGTNVTVTVSRPVIDTYGNTTPDAAITATAAGGTWTANNTTTISTTLTAAAPSASGTLKLANSIGTTTVNATAAAGYAAATPCSISRTN